MSISSSFSHFPNTVVRFLSFWVDSGEDWSKIPDDWFIFQCKKAAVFFKGLCWSSFCFLVCLSHRAKTNQQKCISESSRKIVFMCCGVCGWLPRPSNFMPEQASQKCSGRSRGMLCVGLEAVVVVNRSGECCYCSVTTTWRSNDFQKAGATHTCINIIYE